MKKLTGLIFAGIAVIVLSGCDDGHHHYDDDYPPVDDLTTLFLVDQNGHSYGDIPYRCDSMNRWDATRPNGEFSFYPGEDCEFDFDGLYGNYDDNPHVDDIVYIVDYTDDGKGGIKYECASFGVGKTYGDGSFDYDENDECVFYF